jgi:hypothetical protein
LIEEHSKLVIDGQTQFGMPRGAKNQFGPQ